MLNERVLTSIGRQNYDQYILLTSGKEIDSILDDRSPIFKMYEYRDKLLQEDVGQDINTIELEYLLKNNEYNQSKELLEQLFLESINNSEFKIIEKMLIKHELGWNIKKLVEVHKKYKRLRIFRIINTDYSYWLN